MKRFLFCFVLALLCFTQSKAQSARELRDQKNLVFARNLKDWQQNPVDSLMFDIYYPTGAMSNKKYPVYFSLHGGSFVTATKQSVSEFSDEFAEYGYIVVAPDYRTGYYGSGSGDTCSATSDSTYLQGAIYRAMQDVNACVRYIANHADVYSIDTASMFMGGASAGGTLTLNAAYINDSLAAIHYPALVSQWGKLQTSGNTEPYNYTLKGLCPMWGGLPSWDGVINSKTAIPSILFKGGRDTNLPNGIGNYLNCPYGMSVRAGKGIYDVMQQVSASCVFHFQPAGGHAAYDNPFCAKNTACFFNALIQKQPYSMYLEYYDPSCR